MVPGFENGVIGMQEGEKKTVTLSPDEGYGIRSDDLVNICLRWDSARGILTSYGRRLPRGKRTPTNVGGGALFDPYQLPSVLFCALETLPIGESF